MITNLWVRSMAVAVALVGALLPTSGVWGQEIPIPVVDPDEFISGFEGPIMEINAAAQCVNVMGSDVFIPDALVIDGTVGITGATLNDLLDENAPSRARSVFAGISPIGNPYSGGTFKGLFVYRDGLPICTELVIELAENVAAGTVQNVDVEAKTFSLNGVPCVMNADERFPTEILGIGLEPITFDDVKAAEGIADMTGIGYFHDGVLHVVTLEAEILPQPPVGVDAVRIAQTRGRDRGRGAELRAEVVTTFEAGKTITLYDDLGSILGIAQVELDPVTGEGTVGFRFRNLDRLPTTVRAVSSGGGEHTVEVAAR